MTKMIHDSLKNLDRYAGLFKDFDKIKKAAEAPFDLKIGTNELTGRDLFVNRSNSNTIVCEGREFEMHDIYIDMQCIITGREKMKVCIAEQSGGKVIEGKDVTILEEVEGSVTEIEVNAGEFCLFFPGEYHSPCISMSDVPETVDKLVFKIKSK